MNCRPGAGLVERDSTKSRVVLGEGDAGVGLNRLALRPRTVQNGLVLRERRNVYVDA